MSFFYQEAKRKKKQTKLDPSAAPAGHRKSNKQSCETLNRLGCKGCPLNNADVQSPKMEPSGSRKPLIMFLGEAPGAEEDKRNKPFVGKSGQLLRAQIPDDFITDVAFNNVVQTRPENNRTPTWVEVECCRPRVIRQVEELKPKIIVGLGAVALDWALQSVDLKGLRGRLFAIRVGTHDCWFYPTYHPSFILRQGENQRDPMHTRMGHCFRMDIQKICELADDYWEAKVDTAKDAEADLRLYFSKDNDHKAVIAEIKQAHKTKLIAIDLETDQLYPYTKDPLILSISITTKEGTFGFDLDHPQSKWTKDQRQQILDALYSILMDPDCDKIAHNTPFELGWLIKYLEVDFVRKGVWHCTMVQATMLDERTGEKQRDDEARTKYQGLGFLTKLHFGLDIKKITKVNRKKLVDEKIEDIVPYNAIDSKYTYKLHLRQIKLIRFHDLESIYYFHIERLPTVAIMTKLGLPIDQQAIKNIQTRLGREIQDITAEIQNLKVVKDYKKANGSFNPMSTQEQIVILRDYLKRKEIMVPKTKHSKDEFKESADENVLKQIDHPFAKLILDLRNRSKLKSTYIDELELDKGSVIFPDGYIHPTFNSTFAETGRLSADNPSVQNWPKRKDGWIRAGVAAPKGHKLLSIDYGQIEACTAAMCSKDKYLVDALWDRYDIHMEWAERIGAQYPYTIDGKANLKDKDIMKGFRQKVKNKMVFPSIFGAMPKSVAGYMDMELEDVEDIMDQFWGYFHGLKDWQDKTMKRYYKYGYVESLTHRRRRYPLSRNQAINHPIQCTASEIVVDAMNRISRKWMKNQDPNRHHRLNVHDDLTSMVEDKESVIDDTLAFFIREMLSVPFDWVNVPISVEAKIGQNWFEMTEIGKFYSNEDL